MNCSRRHFLALGTAAFATNFMNLPIILAANSTLKLGVITDGPNKRMVFRPALPSGFSRFQKAMLEEFAQHFRSWKIRWQMEGFAPVRAAWLAAAATTRGDPIRVRLATASLHGCFLDMDEEGALLLEAAGESITVQLLIIDD